MRFRKVVAVDFDGVIHRHAVPWTKPHEINDGPVEGVFDFLDKVIREFDLAVFSARANDKRARYAIVNWLYKKWPTLSLDWARYDVEDAFILKGVPASGNAVVTVKITAQKPHAFLYIDDRGWRFDGTTFPTMDELRVFAECDSWAKKVSA